MCLDRTALHTTNTSRQLRSNSETVFYQKEPQYKNYFGSCSLALDSRQLDSNFICWWIFLCFSPKNDRMQARRRKRVRVHMKHTVTSFKYGYQAVSVRRGFSMCGHITLVATIWRFDSYVYRAIIDNCVLPFIYDVHGGPASSGFLEDNRELHRAKCIADYTPHEKVVRLKWSAQSPDLNPIKNVWDWWSLYYGSISVHEFFSLWIHQILTKLCPWGKLCGQCRSGWQNRWPDSLYGL